MVPELQYKAPHRLQVYYLIEYPTELTQAQRLYIFLQKCYYQEILCRCVTHHIILALRHLTTVLGILAKIAASSNASRSTFSTLT